MNHTPLGTQFDVGRRIGVLLALLLLAPLLIVAATATTAAAQPNGATCYAVSDLGGEDEGLFDNLISITNGTAAIVGQMGTNDAEAFAIRPGDTAYAWSGLDGLGLVTVNLATGATADASFDVNGAKVEGLTWAGTDDADLTNDILYVIRDNGLVEGFDATGAATGFSESVVSGAFVEGTDIAWDPIDDVLYAIRTDNSGAGDNTQIVTVNEAAAGGVVLVGDSVVDLEGLGFTNDGTMIGTTGDDGGSADNLYVVDQTDGSVGASLADLSSSVDNEDVDCLNPDLPTDPGVLSATASVACDNDTGTITVEVSHDSGDDDADYTITATGETDITGTISAGAAPAAETFTGLADGDYVINATNTTDDPDTSLITDQTVTVACTGAAGVLDATVTATCVNFGELGEIEVSVEYTSGDNPADYRIEVTAQADVVGQLMSGDAPAVETYTGLGDANYVVTVIDATGADALVTTETVPIDCGDSPGVITGQRFFECVGDDGLLRVDVRYVEGDRPVDYLISVTGFVDETGSIGPISGTLSQTYPNLADGSYIVRVENVTDDIRVRNVRVDVACDPVPAALSAQVVSGCADENGTISVAVMYDNGDLPAAYTVEVTGQADETGTLNPGDVSDVYNYDGLADGTYVVTVTDTTNDVVVGDTDQVIFCDEAGFAGFAQVECRADDLGGDIRFVLNNGTAAAASATLVVETLANDVATVPAGATVVVQRPSGAAGLADGTYDVEILGLDNPYMDSLTVDCSLDPAAAVGDIVCGGPASLQSQVTLTLDATDVETATDFVVTFDGAATTYPVAAGATEDVVLGPLETGTFPLVVETAAGLSVLATNVTVQDPCFVATAQAVCNVTAPTENNIQVTFVNNSAATAVNIEVSDAGGLLGSLNDTIPADFITTLTPAVTPPDGSVTVVVTAAGITVLNTTLELNCENPPDPGVPEALISEVVCSGGAAFATVDLSVTGGNQAFVFTVSVDGTSIAQGPVTVAANGSEVVSLGPLALEDVVIEVTTTDLTETATIDGALCGQAPVLSASTTQGLCSAGATIDVTLTAEGGGLPASFIVSINDNTFPTQTIQGGDTQTQTYGPFPNGAYLVNVVDLDDNTLLNQLITVDCTEVTAEVVCSAGNVGSIEFTLANASGADVDFTTTVVGEVPESVDTTVAAGMIEVETRGPLADGTYTVSAAEDGELVNIANLAADTIEVMCVTPGTATAAVSGIACADTENGAIVIDLAVVGGTVSADFVVTVDGDDEPGMPLTIAPDDSVVYNTAQLPADVYEVEVTADGVTLLSDEVEVDCSIQVQVLKSCNGLGVITTTVTNPSAVDVDVEVAISPGPAALTGTVAAGTTEVFVRTARPNGIYSVVVSVDGAEVLSQNVLIDCSLEDPIAPVGPEVMHAVSCLAGNGRVDTNIVNTGAADADYRIEFAGLSPRENTVVASDWWRMPITGRPDGMYLVVVKRDGVVVSTETVTVSCDSAPPVVDTDEVRVVNACRANNVGAVNGYILFQFVNNTAASKSYVIEFEGVPNRSTSAAAFGQAVRAVTGRPDGIYDVTIRNGSDIVEQLAVEVGCD